MRVYSGSKGFFEIQGLPQSRRCYDPIAEANNQGNPDSKTGTPASNTLRTPTNPTAAFDDPNRYQWAAVGGNGSGLKQDQLHQTFYHQRSGGTVGSHDLITKDANTAPQVQPSTGDFDYNSTSITSEYPGLTPGIYTVTQGDSLQSIALSLYGDASLWYVLADANGLKGNEPLKEGLNLKLPNEVVNARNTADTFKPFNPAEQIGKTSPDAPTAPPPPKAKCGVFLQILTVVVTVVVSFYLGPVAGALVGNAFGQLANMAVGNQSGFSWRSFAMAGVTAYVTAGLTQGLGLTSATGTGTAFQSLGSTGGTIARAVATNAVSQGVNIALKQQEKFSWGSLAASAAMAGFAQTEAYQKAMGAVADSGYQSAKAFGASFDVARTTANTVTNFINGVATRAIQVIVDGKGKVDFASIAADSFGNALGNSIVGRIEARSERATLDEGGRFAYDGAIDYGFSHEQAMLLGGQASRFSDALNNDPARRDAPLMNKLRDSSADQATASSQQSLQREAGVVEEAQNTHEPGVCTPENPEGLTQQQRMDQLANRTATERTLDQLNLSAGPQMSAVDDSVRAKMREREIANQAYESIRRNPLAAIPYDVAIAAQAAGADVSDGQANRIVIGADAATNILLQAGQAKVIGGAPNAVRSQRPNTNGRPTATANDKGVVMEQVGLRSGTVKIETGATPTRDEVRAAKGLAKLGYNVTLQVTASQRTIHNVQTPDLYVRGLGKIDVITPEKLTTKAISGRIEAKATQAPAVVVKANISRETMHEAALRVWGKPRARNIQTIYFQSSKDVFVRFDRPRGQ